MHHTINTLTSSLRKVRRRTSVIALFLGMAIILATIFLGRSYVLYISILVLSFFITILWRKTPQPWIYLASVAASTPIALFKQQYTCNLIFAVWFTLFNMHYLSKLPKWLYILLGLGVIGFVTSSLNWISGGSIVQNIIRQGAFAFNFLLGPIILLPMVYVRMSESRDHLTNLKGLLFCLIIPTTLILMLAKLFGTVANEWEVSLHVEGLSEGYLEYQLGKVIIDFRRTSVGFILAALICASAALVVAPVTTKYKVLASACLSLNIFLLLASGSFGSIFSCLCGVAAIFYGQFRTVSIKKVLVSVSLICCMMLLIYGLSPSSTKNYLGKRYEHRVVNADTDRLTLWARGIESLLEHPEGVGLTFRVGEIVKSNPHNDYIAYLVSYGAIGGLAYSFLVIGLLIYFFKGQKRRIKGNAVSAIHHAGLGVIVAFSINSMTDNIAVNRWYFHVIWSLIWYCYFCSRAGQSVINGVNITRQTAVAVATTHRLK